MTGADDNPPEGPSGTSTTAGPIGAVLVVTAVEAEAQAFRDGLPPAGPTSALVHVNTVGVGPAAAAAGTARLLALAEAADRPYRAVISAGIAGGFPAAPLGATVLAVRSIAADLGAESPGADPAGFLSIDELGFGSGTHKADEALLAALRAALPDAVVGDILTVSTVTGTATSSAGLIARFPAAVAETMEGYGVACAAAGATVPFAELRTVSNPVGPRDRAAWRIGDALAALTTAATAITTAPLPWPALPVPAHDSLGPPDLLGLPTS